MKAIKTAKSPLDVIPNKTIKDADTNVVARRT